jgi:hypothetical protein
MQISSALHALAIARTRVRLNGHILLGIQTDTAVSEDGILEGYQRSLSLERHMDSAWTADSFLNLMLHGINARDGRDFLSPGNDPFIRTFRSWDVCSNCHCTSTRNCVARRSAINTITPDACARLQSRSLVSADTLEETVPTPRQVNILKVYENLLTAFVPHPAEPCLRCLNSSSESWVNNARLDNPPPFLILAFPDEAVVYSAEQIPIILMVEAVTMGTRKRHEQMKYQLLHVIQKNAVHYRDVGIELTQTSDLRHFPTMPWIMNDNTNILHVGIPVNPPVLPTDTAGFRPVLAVYYCTAESCSA